MDIDYSLLPTHMQEGAQLYLEYGVEPGAFFRSILENDLKGAFTRADFINQHRIEDFVYWVIWHCPMAAQGSPEIVNAWIESRQAKRKRADPIINPKEEDEE